MKPQEYLRILGLEVLFRLGLTCYQWQVGTNSLKMDEKKVNSENYRLIIDDWTVTERTYVLNSYLI